MRLHAGSHPAASVRIPTAACYRATVTRLPGFILTVALFTLIGPPIAGVALWLVWLVGALWRPDAWSALMPSIAPWSAEAWLVLAAALAGSYALGAGLAFSVGLLVAIAGLRRRMTLSIVFGAVVVVHVAIFFTSLLDGVAGLSIDRLPYFPAAPGAHYLFPLSLFAATACWALLRGALGPAPT